jgi:hypothetical protein
MIGPRPADLAAILQVANAQSPQIMERQISSLVPGANTLTIPSTGYPSESTGWVILLSNPGTFNVADWTLRIEDDQYGGAQLSTLNGGVVSVRNEGWIYVPPFAAIDRNYYLMTGNHDGPAGLKFIFSGPTGGAVKVTSLSPHLTPLIWEYLMNVMSDEQLVVGHVDDSAVFAPDHPTVQRRFENGEDD